MKLIKIFLVLIAIFFLSTSSFPSDFKFVILGDSQFNNTDVFENMTKEVELLKPAFVIQVGDMIHGLTYDKEELQEEWARFKKQISPITMPFYPVPGNHDVGTQESEEVFGEVWGKNKYYYSWDYENNHFIVLDSDYKIQYNTIGDEQIEWLKKDLEEHKNADNIFIFLHRAIFIEAKDEEDAQQRVGNAYMRSEKNKSREENERDSGILAWEKIHPILTKYPVRAVIGGHYHCYTHYQKDGIDYIITNAAGIVPAYQEELGLFYHFLVISVQDKNVTTALIKAGSVLPEDYVSDDERKHYPPYLLTDRGYQIQDLSEKDAEFDFSFPLSNGTNEERTFDTVWTVPRETFKLEPMKQTIKLAPKQSTNVVTKFKVKKGQYSEKDLPYCTITSPYKTTKGKDISLKATYSLFIPKKAYATFTKKSPRIDGKLDETVWNEAKVITNLETDKKGTLALYQTFVYVLYDDKNLYVGIRGADEDSANLIAGANGPIKYLWGDDDFELFFDTNHNQSSFFRMMTNSIGTTFTSSPAKGLYEGGYTVKTYVGKEFWSAEFKIPFKEFGLNKPEPGTIWGFNIRRHNQKPERIQSDWSKMENVPYEPWRFGLLIF